MTKKKSGGYKIVLTADRTLMSEYSGGIFLGFSACIPSGLLPDWVYFSLFCPTVDVNKDGSPKVAPCGTRKTEAALLNNGFSREDLIVAHPDHLSQVIGKNTKAVGITENDPLGMGPATSTFTQVFNVGDAYMKMKFIEILNNPAVQKYKPKIIVGGAGAWQLEDEAVRKDLGVDCVVMGEGEGVVDSLFEAAVKGGELPGLVHGPVVEEADIPVIQDATIDGIIEIARGCGRGCAFCVPTMQRYRCLPLEHILKEVEVNLRAKRRPLLHAEDVLRYKAKGFEVNRAAVKELFETVYHYPGVESVGLSHFALSSIASAPDLMEDLTRILEVGEKGKDPWLSGQTGVETGSPRLIRELMAGKAKPFTPEQWPDMVVDAFQILQDNLWVPCATLIVGLPGETEKDADLTLDLIERLHEFKSLLIPLFMVSEGELKNKAESFRVNSLSRKQSEVFLKCWQHNFDWAETFMKEYYVTKASFGAGFGLKLVLSYALKQAQKMMQTCKNEYDYDLAAMINDAHKGKYPFSMPLRTLYKIIMFGSKKESKY